MVSSFSQWVSLVNFNFVDGRGIQLQSLKLILLHDENYYKRVQWKAKILRKDQDFDLKAIFFSKHASGIKAVILLAQNPHFLQIEMLCDKLK